MPAHAFAADHIGLVEDRSILVRNGLKKSSSLDFSRLKRKLNVEGGSLCPDCDISAEFAERQYRQFLALQFAYEEIRIVPTKLIDSFWHAHILDTRAYQRDCDYMFGYFLHHNPYLGIGGAEDSSNLASAFALTSQMWLVHFGRPLNTENTNHQASKCSDCSSCSSCSR